ncbi:MAG: aminoacetone oxidase family FAD-binding enzyme [Opitutales bacterium]|nr:aminoacetone oxidase family FAD-binding enzyme [Opitutales bacterium]
MKIAIVGAGAAGMFCAANLKGGFETQILEAGSRALRKVEQSGGGRCNITNAQKDVGEFIKAYPRGGGRLRKPLMNFGNEKLLKWFEGRGVEFAEEDCGRIFPKSGASLEIVSCLESEAKKRGAIIRKNFEVKSVSKTAGEKYMLSSESGDIATADAVLFAVGGAWNKNLQASLERLGHKFIKTLPSLFGFKTKDETLQSLAGTAVFAKSLKCREFGFETGGELLFTHEGISGPAALKMSSLGARVFFEKGYKIELELSLFSSPEVFDNFCKSARMQNAKKLVKNFSPAQIPQKFWEFLLEKSGVESGCDWAHFAKDAQKNLRKNLCEFKIETAGKAARTREFVSAGGLDLSCVDFKTMQSKTSKNIFFAGECLDIDAFTGGYNLQAAWTTAFTAAEAINKLA